MNASMDITPNELLLTLNEYLTRAIPDVQKLADDFYQSPTAGAWRKFDQLVEAFQWISIALPMFGGYANSSEFESALIKVNGSMAELANAVENNDIVLIADCLNYEVLTILKELDRIAKITIQHEVKEDDPN